MVSQTNFVNDTIITIISGVNIDLINVIGIIMNFIVIVIIIVVVVTITDTNLLGRLCLLET